MIELNRGLSPLKKSFRFPFAVWDIEASDWWNLQLVGCFDGKRYVYFRTIGEFLEFITRKEFDGYHFFAHFGGRYDIQFVYDYIRANMPYEVSFHFTSSTLQRMRIHRSKSHKHSVVLCDSYRLLPGSLRDLGIAFDVEHKKTKVDYSHIEFNRELIDYNENDCRCLYEIIDKFFKMSGDIYSETLASHALATFRRDFLKTTLFKPPAEVEQAVRKTYHGGRVEVFQRKAPMLNAYDVNSMYPHVMREAMPVEFVGRQRKLIDSEKLFGFIEATIFIPEMYVPPLPVRVDGSGRLFFPTGKVRRWWTSEELIQAETYGAKIIRIHHAYYFHTDKIFGEYIARFYALKKTAGEPMRTIAKLLLNTLYGKFGQKPERKWYETYDIAEEGAFPIISPSTGIPTGFCEITGISKASHLLPHIASAVTAKARLHLTKQLNEKTYYCDTDSIFTTGSMQDSKELGEWGYLGSGEAEFYQPKLYKYNGKWKAKGLNREQSIDDYVNGSANLIVRTRGVKEAMRQDITACAHVEVEKFLRESKPKRVWLLNGNTRAWDIEEL